MTDSLDSIPEPYFRLLEIIGVWLAALATFVASFVALRISWQQTAERLTTRFVVGNDEELPIRIEFRNIGQVEVEIVEIVAASLLFPRRSEVLKLEVPDTGQTAPFSVAARSALRVVPGNLLRSESLSQIFPFFYDPGVPARLRRFGLFLFRLEILSAGGRRFICRPPPRLRRLVLEDLRKRVRMERET
ncbi:MAG: hypothetical protein AAGG56_05150 [Pseudomonadota bacterium]